MAATRPADPAAVDRRDSDAPSISGLLKRLGNESGELVRAEVALAKLEFRELARQAALDGMKVGAAAALALVGAIALAGAAILGLGDVLDGRYGIAALLVGVVLLVTGALLAWSGARSMARTRAPVASLREDGQWAAGELRGLRQQLQGTVPTQRQPALTHKREG